MSTLVLPKLLLRPLTLWNLFVIGCLGLLLGQSARMVRGTMALAEGPSGSSDGGPVIVLVGAAAIGALVGWAAFEVLSCPYSAAVPRLHARMRDETVGLCVLVALIAGAIASNLAGSAAGAATGALSMLAFGLGFFGSDPRSRPHRGLGWLYIVLFLALVVVSPDVPRWSQAGLALVMLAAIAMGPVLILLAFRPERRRVRALTETHHLDPAYRDIDIRSGTWGLRLDAPRDGAMRIVRTLRTDWDWARAMLHEAHGWQRGGWIGTALIGGGIFGPIAVALAAGVFGTSGGTDWVGRVTTALLVAPSGARTGFAVGLSFFLTIWFSMASLNTPFLPVISALRPLARARRARVAWLATLADDVLAVLAIGVATALLALVAHRLRPDVQPSPGLPAWLPHVLVLLLASPIARWARLKFLDVAHGQPGAVRQGFVAGVTICVLSAGCSWVAAVWTRTPHLPAAGSLLAFAGALAALQGLWFLALARHHERADLAA